MKASLVLFGVFLAAGALSQARTADSADVDAPDPQAQAPATPAPAPAPPPPPPTAWTYKGFSASGYVDVYYNYNENRPSGSNGLQAFNTTANELSLSSLTGSFALDPAPFGFRVDVGYGNTYDAFYASEPTHTDWSRYLLNAYVSYKIKQWKGVQIDFGKFVTSAGAEVTETHLNWNYSRSLLFALGPYYHTGLRVSVPINPNWTVGTQVVTGWNLMRDNNSGKTVGLTSANTLAGGKVVIANNYYMGPENNNTNVGWRNFYDLVVNYNPSAKVSTYFNMDIGSNKNIDKSLSKFYGFAGAAKIQLTNHFALIPRLEYYNDRDGYWTGLPQQLNEFTITGEAKLNDSFFTRLEYRRDWSSQPYFQVNGTPFASKHQNMVVLGFVAWLKPGLFKF